MANRLGRLLTVVFEVVAAVVVAAAVGWAVWLIWGGGVIAFGAASILIGAAGQTLISRKRWAGGVILIVVAALASLVAFFLLLPRPAAPPPPPPPPPPSALLLPGVRAWANGVVPICWLNRTERGVAGVDELRAMLGVKGAEETWAATGAVSFQDVGVCPADFHGVKLLIGRAASDADTPALGAAIADQAQPVTVPFVYANRSGCNPSGRFGSVDACVQGEAVHEFGHVLGLPDIHYSRQAPDSCKTTLRQDRAPLDIPYDPASVMNACNADHLTGRLSPGDIAAIRQIYRR